MSDITKIKVDGEPESSYKLFPKNREFEKRAGGNTSSQSGVQPDWNQNDSTAADYVKNRPFYTGDPVETVLVEESTVTFTEGSGGLYGARFQSTFEAKVGETYKVSWDGSVYECPCVAVSGMSFQFIGNLSITGLGSDTGEPFVMAASNGNGIEIVAADTSASHTFSISSLVPKVVNIDRNYLPAPFRPEGTSYLTFSSPNSFTLEVDGKTKGWYGTLEYFASNRTWTIWNGASALSAVYDYGEYVLYLRGTGNTIITGSNTNNIWVLTGTDIKCIGNIENLLDYATVTAGNHPTMATNCYRNMFKGCTSLTKAPELPATTLANICYSSMFNGCTSLTQAPELPATTLADDCYLDMFNGCTSLKLSTTQTGEYAQEYRIPTTGAGTTATSALTGMFTSTGGTFTGTPEINTTYYLSTDNMIVRDTEIATLNGYVGSMVDTAIEKYADTAEYIIPSSTPDSTKKFKITVDDSGALTATEVT